MGRFFLAFTATPLIFLMLQDCAEDIFCPRKCFLHFDYVYLSLTLHFGSTYQIRWIKIRSKHSLKLYFSPIQNFLKAIYFSTVQKCLQNLQFCEFSKALSKFYIVFKMQENKNAREYNVAVFFSWIIAYKFWFHFWLL